MIKKIKNFIKNTFSSLRKIKELKNEIATLNSELENNKTWVPLGHFYSPIPSLNEIKKNENKIFSNPRSIESININEGVQLEIYKKIINFYHQLPFVDDHKDDLLYYFKNPAFSYADGISLYSMIRIFEPKRLIEVGSGYSSCVSLDTNRLFLSNKMDLIFIEPYPELLKSLTSKTKTPLKIIDINLQDVSIEVFKNLEKNDILFIDSTHVSKTGSDVNYIFFEILPVLKSGVVVHFHDIFYPFEYPKSWVYEGRSWNEDYMLRAFLQYNDQFEILFFNDFMFKKHRDLLEEHTPLYLKNGGGSIWLRKK